MVRADGSSPRGRGKPGYSPYFGIGKGSSPRGRGKPHAPIGGDSDAKAHPRAGGENYPSRGTTFHTRGSSPRGRGKQGRNRTCLKLTRLIPARAGKTSPIAHAPIGGEAHPRAGGENDKTADWPEVERGSSPRGRGKRRVLAYRFTAVGLIPARAGKTLFVRLSRFVVAAHPRAGGENVHRRF